MIWTDIPPDERAIYQTDGPLRLTQLRFLATNAERTTFIDSIVDEGLKAKFTATWAEFVAAEADRAARLAAAMPPPAPPS
jgi:hypothetical protein